MQKAAYLEERQLQEVKNVLHVVFEGCEILQEKQELRVANQTLKNVRACYSRTRPNFI